MSGDRGGSIGNNLSVSGHRKRSRTPSSTTSESRLAPRDPSRRARGDGSGRTSNNTPPSPRVSQSTGNLDEFLDDVRFDVAPKDMCIAASQDAANGDGSVVLQQLCSLGSVLAGGKSDAAAAAEEESGFDPSLGDGNNSRGAFREDSIGGGNLLTRWLQPAAAATGGHATGGRRTTREGEGCDAPSRDTDAAKTTSVGVGGGARVVGDLAKKALLRKKLADAERGRRLRLQLEEASLAGGLEACGAESADKAAAPSPLVTPSAVESISPIVVADSAEAAANKIDVTDLTLSRQGSPDETVAVSYSAAPGSTGSAPVTAASAVADASNTSGGTGTAVGAPKYPASGSVGSGGEGGCAGVAGGTNGIVVKEDDFVDDFAFLTDADLQALEEEATRRSAASSQRASQDSSRGDSTSQTKPALQSRPPTAAGRDHSGQGAPRSGGARNGGWDPGNAGSGASRKSGNPDAYASTGASAGQHMAGKKRQGGFGSRPPLSVLGPNPKRGGDYGQRGSTPSTLKRAFSGGSSGSFTSQDTGSSQDNNSNSRAPRHWQGQARAMPGRGEGANNTRRTSPPNVPALRKSGAGVETGVGDASRRRGVPMSGGGVAVEATPGPANAKNSKLYTTYGSMEEFTKATGSGRRAGQGTAGQTAAGAVPGQGQARLTDWGRQPKQLPGTTAAAAGAAAGAVEGSTSAAIPPAPYVPALVYRRFVVLEVTYVSARHGNGSREKTLMALEQRLEGSTAADACLDTLLQAEGRTGTGMAHQRRISLVGDWYDCDVEPGDVVHVLFPLGPDRAGGLSAMEDSQMEEEEEMMKSHHVVVDNASGRLLIVQPDILVSPTKVADTVVCARKAVLQSRLASDASKSKPAVLGNLKHELFETSLLAAAAAAKSISAPQRGTAASNSGRPESPPAGAAASAWQGPRAGNGGGPLTSQYMAKLVESIVVSQLEALYGAGLDEDTARRELMSVSGPILSWHRAFLAKHNAAGVISPGRGGPARVGAFRGGVDGASAGGFASLGADGAPAARVTISRVLATEDDVWSPVLGLKGIMDATVEAVVQPLVRGGQGRSAGAEIGLPAGMALGGGGEGEALVIPVEVKTGKRIGDARTGHRAQVMLYTLLLRMRYGNQASKSGLLVYTSPDGLHTELVSPVAAEIRALVLARNRHATGMAKIGRVGLVRGEDDGRAGQGGAALPPVIRRTRECGMCFQNSECMLYHRAAEGGDEESSGLERGVFDGKVGHLGEAHLAFFAHWDRTIDLEAKIGEQVRRTMWQDGGPDREARTNKCMSSLVWLGEREHESVTAPAANNDQRLAGNGKRFTHVFCREWAIPEALQPDTARGKRATLSPSNVAVAATTQKNGADGDDADARPKWAKPLTDLSLSVGDMVCVSSQRSGDTWSRRRGGRGGELEHVRLLTGNIAAIYEDRVEIWSDKRMRVPRRSGRRSGSGRGAGGEAGEALDIEDLLRSERSAEGDRLARERVLFRIDRDEWAASISMMRSNLVKLMAGPSPESEAAGDTKNGGDNAGDEKRRRLIVDLDPPRFGRFTGLLDVPGTLLGWAGDRYGGSNKRPRNASEDAGRTAGGVCRGSGGGEGGEGGAQGLEVMFRTALNEDQRAAVRKLVTAKDYALLLGMPGTGKTWTIAFAVRVLLARGASVLITSYTHSAVDNLLLKLLEEGVPCLRVGKPSSVHPGVREHCINYDGSAKTTAAYSELVASAKVVGCTCLGVKHPLFSQKRFDYCVVDEAGQISQPVVLAPLRCADVFVLVGDHYQLPPLVTSSEALEAGMSESLFRRLCEAHPASLQRLSYQYRMNGDVMALCNDLTYSGRLRCGNARVEDQRLVVPSLAALPPPQEPPSLPSKPGRGASQNDSAWQGRTPPSGPTRSLASAQGGTLKPWLAEVLDPGIRVVFLDTDAISPGKDEAGGSLSAWEGGVSRPFAGLEIRSAVPENGGAGALVNSVECDVVRLLAWGLDTTGFDLEGVGIISPYRSQVHLLQTELRPSYPGLEINTIDKYQGRDKQVIVVSFVRSNAEGTVGHLLRDWRRLNVALSRAKRKLVLVGSLRTLSSCTILSSLTGILKKRGWVYPLPPGGHRTYPQGLADLCARKAGAVVVSEIPEACRGDAGFAAVGSRPSQTRGRVSGDGGGVVARGAASSMSGVVGASSGISRAPPPAFVGGGGGGGARAGKARQRSAD